MAHYIISTHMCVNSLEDKKINKYLHNKHIEDNIVSSSVQTYIHIISHSSFEF